MSKYSEFFQFKVMISSEIIRTSNSVGAIIITGFGIFRMVGDLGYNSILIGIIIVLMGNIVWRILCEGWILFFSIQETLSNIEKNTRQYNS